MKITARNIVALLGLLLPFLQLSASTDTLGNIVEKNRRDTVDAIQIFKIFTWKVTATFNDGKTASYVSSRPDTLFHTPNLSSVRLTTDFYVDTQARDKILYLHYNLEGSVKILLNGISIVETGKFSKGGPESCLVRDEYKAIIFNDQFGQIEVEYLTYNTYTFDLDIRIYQRHLAEKEISDEISDVNDANRKGIFYLAFGIVFLILFVYFRKNTEYLYFSMFCLFGAMSFIWRNVNSDILYGVSSFFGIFCFEFLSIFFCRVLKNKEKSKIPLLIIALAMGLCFLPFIRFGIYNGNGGKGPFILLITFSVLYVYTWISTLYYLVRGIGQKRWEARVILISCLVPLVIFAMLLLVFVIAFSFDPAMATSKSIYRVLISYFASSIVYIYPLAAVFILGRRNAMNQLKLTAQVNSIQQLSDENLAIEKEKQDILLGQKESLEQEVAIRTQEIVTQKEEIEKKHGELKIEKEKSDELLRNILPQEVAEELKANGTTVAKHYDNVTVLFTDFVNFTSAGEQMKPQQLIDELHNCFKVFDNITGKYGIEKIKTIGDAYLAVCGLPSPDPKHAENIVAAAIEINAFMANRLANLGGDRTFAIRIGIHSGSVVAGIVGVKKFAYDIWGDTVNTAARMEQNSEAGKINISQTTYELVKDKFSCEYRGEIEAKGKGVMKMYYIVLS